MGLMQKLKNLYFLILKFCFHDVTLEANLERWACGVYMVDGALKRLDVALCTSGTIGLNSVCICGVRSNLLTQLLSENNFDALFLT